MLEALLFCSHLDTSWTLRSLSSLARFSTWNGSRSTMLALRPHRGASRTCTMFSTSSWKRYKPQSQKKSRRMCSSSASLGEQQPPPPHTLKYVPEIPNNVKATCETEGIFLFVNRQRQPKIFSGLHFVPPLSFLCCLSRNPLYLVEVPGCRIKYGTSVKLITKYRMINGRGADWTLQMFKELK